MRRPFYNRSFAISGSSAVRIDIKFAIREENMSAYTNGYTTAL